MKYVEIKRCYTPIHFKTNIITIEINENDFLKYLDGNIISNIEELEIAFENYIGEHDNLYNKIIPDENYSDLEFYSIKESLIDNFKHLISK